MNDASRWRQALARQIAPAYAADPKVAAVVGDGRLPVGGSSARGHADRHSDIEIGVFWHEPPADAERRAAVEQMGGDLIRRVEALLERGANLPMVYRIFTDVEWKLLRRGKIPLRNCSMQPR